MAFMDLIRNRYSVRAYRADPVEEDKLITVLEAARLAPTAGNQQAFDLVVVRTEAHRDALHRIYSPAWFVQPPLVIFACAAAERKLDIGIVMDHLILAATDLGLGTCWVGAFDHDAASKFLGLPEGIEPIICTPLGYPADAPRPKQRKPLEALVRYDHW